MHYVLYPEHYLFIPNLYYAKQLPIWIHKYTKYEFMNCLSYKKTSTHTHLYIYIHTYFFLI